MTPSDERQLDNPAYAALTGAHARFAETRGRIVRYEVDVAPFLALPPEPTAEDWVDAARLAGDGGYIAAAAMQTAANAPAGWTTVGEFELVQMIEEDLRGVEDPGAVLLARDDCRSGAGSTQTPTRPGSHRSARPRRRRGARQWGETDGH